MARMIDVDALRYMTVAECSGHSIEYAMGWKTCIDWIKTLPAVDAAPVVHGRWIKLVEAPEWDQRRCSVCGDVSCCQRNYCPNCGAKMDGGETDGTVEAVSVLRRRCETYN